MTHRPHNGNSWVSWRVRTSVNGDYADAVCPSKHATPCVSLAACEPRTKLQAVISPRQHLWRRRRVEQRGILLRYKSIVRRGGYVSAIPSLLSQCVSGEEWRTICVSVSLLAQKLQSRVSKSNKRDKRALCAEQRAVLGAAAALRSLYCAGASQKLDDKRCE